MMPGMMISCVFAEELRLSVQTVPLKIELAGAMKPVDDASNRIGIQIRPPNHPRCAGCRLLPLQQARLHEPFDRTVTDLTDPGRFAQTDSLRIGLRSFLTGNRIIVPGGGHTGLIPPFPLSGAISLSVRKTSPHPVWSNCSR